MEKIKSFLQGRERNYEQLRDMSGMTDEHGEASTSEANVYLDIEDSHLPTASERAHRYIAFLRRLRAPPIPAQAVQGVSRDFYYLLARVVLSRIELDSSCYFEIARGVLECAERGEVGVPPMHPRAAVVIVAGGVDDETYRVDLMAVFEVLFIASTIITNEVHAGHEMAVRVWDDLSSFLRRFGDQLTQFQHANGLRTMGLAPVDPPVEGTFNPAKWLVITRRTSPLAEYARNVVCAALDPSLVPDEDLRITVTGDNMCNVIVQVLAQIAGNKTLAQESVLDKTDWHVFTIWPFLCWQYAITDRL